AMEWSEAAVKGSTPPGRRSHTAIYLPEREQMLVFGGYGRDGKRFDDLWILDMKAMQWSEAAVKGSAPPARGSHTAIYLPERQQMLVFGGYGGGGGKLFNDLWTLDMKEKKAVASATLRGAMENHNSAALEEGERLGLPVEVASVSPGNAPRATNQAEDAEAKLREAMDGNDSAALEDAVTEGERVGLPDEVLLEAYEAMPRVEAAQSLVKAMSGLHGLEALQKALEKAKELKVNSKVLVAGHRAMRVIQKDAGGDQGYVGPTLKEALPDGTDAVPGMFSARFDNGEIEHKFRRIHRMLQERNFPVRMVAAGGGDDFSRSTMKYLNELREKGGVMICVCTEHYAEKTKSPFSSFHELKYAQDYCLDVLPLKVADKFPPEPPSGPQHPYDKDGDAPAVISMVFRPNVVFTDCCQLDEMAIARVIADKLLKKRELAAGHG
ncbi:DRC7, partial [Symbiodinium microadriaticum]